MRALALAAALALLATPALALQRPKCGKEGKPEAFLDNRICSFEYKENEVYRVPLHMMGSVMLVFHPDDDVDLGGSVNPDNDGIEIIAPPGSNLLLLKPKLEDRAGRVMNVPVFAIDKITRQRRSIELEIEVRKQEIDAREEHGSMVRGVFHFPGRDLAKQKWEREQREAVRRASLPSPEEVAAKRAEVSEQRAGERLEVAHFQGAGRTRRYSRQAEGLGLALLKEMENAGFRISDNGQVTTLEMPPGVPGVAVFWHDPAVGLVTAPPIPKDGGAWVIPKVSRTWSFSRGDAVFCMWRDLPIQARDPGTGTIDSGVTVVPRVPAPPRPRTSNIRAEAPAQ